ncbi:MULTISPECIES: B3/B4 domain-containing protein [Laceyella]|jgi:DNA/RNA-binding domain of Phe-tRNA-synthetase-like protein|uniref:Phenylalanine--tRNA ligase beta subunit-related protein n=2 Tax=Laceyella TaxID=292635 RepID=A0ABY5U8M0_LACSH|nr:MULTISPECIES: phenylalanine--tRNA ligase beta subunit-related protein [Laceyella]KPC73874.1 hypothetical protein ADL26_12560 [Thermoactinomyces vulgaris]PRZ12029.1 DNA/RNA-binding domain of Phe-tRNA-synthetase-like protein [Laceyella sediminis]TCW40753.1 DNA/RNA-binding domain of Phe-tRNA-synthetase-like protein [Laceyella sacchari]UWE04383.1 phenylalanine--tRNA ligase beta subunit-related protein [Laceyella sacchari]
MKSFHVSLDEKIVQRYPDANVHFMLASNLHRVNHELIRDYLATVETRIDHDRAKEVSTGWRAVYQSMGIKPSKYLCSFESLYKRAVKQKPVFGIHPVVDAYNAISLSYQLCMGAYDLDTVRDEIILRLSAGGELFYGIGMQTPLTLDADAVVYADKKRILCAYWNHRDAEATKITEATRTAIFFADGAKAEDRSRATLALRQLADLLGSGVICSSLYSLDQHKPSASLMLPLDECEETGSTCSF